MSNQNPIDEEPIGDFFNNYVLAWTPISFTVEFIYRMRKVRRQLLNLPSTRQAVAIPKLLTVMYYRKGSLIPDDFIKAAVITTPIEDQEIAQKIAFDILFSDPEQTKIKSKKPDSYKGKATSDEEEAETSDFMDDLLSDIMDAGFDLDTANLNEVMDQALEDFSNLMQFVDMIYEKAGLGEDPYQSLIDILERRDGYKDILGKGITSLEQLRDYIHQIILREMNVLTPQDIKSAVNLNWGDDIMMQSSTPWIKASAMFDMNSPEFDQYLNEIMQGEEVETAARTARYLHESGMSREEAKDLTEQLISRAETIMDITEIARVLDYIPKFDYNTVISNSLQRDMGLSFRLSRQLDRSYDNGHITDQMFQKWAQETPSPSFSELFQAHTDNELWKQMVDTCIQDELNTILSGNGSAAYNMANLARELMILAPQLEYEACTSYFQQKASYVGMEALKTAQDETQFKNVLETLVNSIIKLNDNEVIKLGKALGVSEAEIVEILGGNYELLRSLIKEKIGNFQRYTKILNNIPSLSGEQMKELMQHAVQSGNFQAMGALGHYNLGQAFHTSEQMGGAATRQLSESLSAGPGQNLLLQWFMHRHNIPSKAKEFVRNLVKDALITIALNMISNQRGSGEKGLIPTNKLRIFIDGDDMDLIDIDASIENIIMQGKSLDMITAEDLMVMETEKGRVSICFLLDISGSMTGMKLAACSIAVMVLIGTLRADEVAICFFESNTHVVKEFGDTKDLEDVADELLDLQARGGTQVQQALAWGAHQLEETATELKICFLLTDCEFFEKKEEIIKELDSYVNQKVEFLLGVNTRSYSKQYAEWILDTTQGKIVYILDIRDIPKILMEILEQIG